MWGAWIHHLCVNQIGGYNKIVICKFCLPFYFYELALFYKEELATFSLLYSIISIMIFFSESLWTHISFLCIQYVIIHYHHYSFCSSLMPNTDFFKLAPTSFWRDSIFEYFHALCHKILQTQFFLSFVQIWNQSFSQRVQTSFRRAYYLESKMHHQILLVIAHCNGVVIASRYLQKQS